MISSGRLISSISAGDLGNSCNQITTSSGRARLSHGHAGAQSRSRRQMMTIARKNHRQRLHPGAIRWLLGARSELTESGRITHCSISQYEFLIAKCFTAEEWDDHCAELWAANEAWIQSWHLKRWPHKRPPHTPTEAARDFIARRKAQHPACVVE
jgi:hypothetical protein